MKKIAGFAAILFTAGAITAASAYSAPKTETVQQGKRVKMHYSLSVGETPIASSRNNNEPVELIYGQDPLIPGIQKNIAGMKAGETKKALLQPEEAFGTVSKEAIIEVPKERLPNESIEVGTVYSVTDSEGKEFQGIVSEVREDSVLIDFNHPLAGEPINLEVEILEVQ